MSPTNSYQEYLNIVEWLEAIINAPAADLQVVAQDQSGWIMVSSEQEKFSWCYRKGLTQQVYKEILYAMMNQEPKCLDFIYKARELRAPDLSLEQLITKCLEPKRQDTQYENQKI